MAFVRARARILEISTTSGGGPFALAGAADGSYNRFSSFMSVGDKTYVSVVEPGVAFWTGIATYSAANELTLTTVEESKGTFGSGTKEVMASPLASTSMLREDIAGAIVTAGTSAAYTVASYRKYGSLSELDGNIIAFTPHATNGQGSPNVTLNVDGLGAKTIRSEPTRELPPGVLIAGTPYLALYNHTLGVFFLHGAFGLPYQIPLGASLDYWGSSAPSSAFALMYGQAISRTTYSDLFGLFGTAYGAGDGSTTFNIPDCRGRVTAGKDDMGGAAAGRLTDAVSGFGDGLGEAGGAQTKALATANLPPYTPAGTIANGAITINHNANITGVSGVTGGGSFNVPGTGGASISASQAASTFNGTAQGGTSTPFGVVQPTIIANKLLRVL